MAKRAIFRITVEGTERLAHKLDPDHLYRPPVETLLEEGARAAKAQGVKRAPQRSGQLVGSLRTQLHATAISPYATLTAGAKARDGFPYGYALDASPRFHFIGKRKATRGWFTKIPAIVRRMLSQQLKKAEREIEDQFNSSTGGPR